MKLKKHVAKITFAAILGGLTLPAQLYAAKSGQPDKSHTIYITLKLKNNAPVNVSKAALKYNKQLAFSFTLDDGYHSAFLTAYPLLNGGHISPPFPDEWKNDEGGDGSYSKGLFYSDGCSHNIPFKLAEAINAAGINDMPGNRGHLSWQEVEALYKAGWDILNHGYNHATKHGTDYHHEVIQNTAVVKQRIGFTMTQFVVPGGEADPGYEHEYEREAIQNGNNAVASIKGDGPIIPVDGPVNLNAMVYTRDFVRSVGDDDNQNTANRSLRLLDSLMNLNKPIWFNEFSHGTGNSNLWSLSLKFPEFKYYMTSIANKYGVGGSDKIWMAPWQEVYEYIWLRDRIKLSTTKRGKRLVIKIQVPELPEGFRHKAISLVVNNAGGFVVGASDLKITNNSRLINIEL